MSARVRRSVVSRRWRRTASDMRDDGITRVVILGAAGRDFHNFNMVYRDDPTSIVVAFTATQIPGIADRIYPAALAGPRYPAGIPIVAEESLEQLCRSEHVDQVVFAYSDVPHAHVMHLASRALAAGADFLLLGPQRTMLTRVASGHRGQRAAHRLRQVADRALAGGTSARARPTRRRDPSPDAVRRSGNAARATLRIRRGPGRRPLHARGTRGIRTAHRARQRRVRRRRLCRHPANGRGRGRHHGLGRRQQRLSVHPPRSAHRHRRCVAPRSGRHAPSRRGGRAHGGRAGGEQGRRRAACRRCGRSPRGCAPSIRAPASSAARCRSRWTMPPRCAGVACW